MPEAVSASDVVQYAPYQHNMSLIAQTNVASVYDALTLYDDQGAKRGHGLFKDGKVFVTVFGDSPAYLKAVLSNKTDGVQTTALNQIVFQPNAVLGAPQEPYLLRIGAQQEPLSFDTVTILPNPFNQSLTVYAEPEEVVSLTIIDGTGKTVVQQEVTSKVTQLNTSSLASGLHLVRVFYMDGSSQVHKLVKE